MVPSARPRQAAALTTTAALMAGILSVQKFTRGDGDVTWRHPQHRLVLPLSDAHDRKVTVQLEGGPAREFVWHDALGFYPAGTQARIATSAATSLHLLWPADAAAGGRAEPLLPFEDPLIVANVRAIANELDDAAPDRLFVESLGNAVVIKLMRRFSATVEREVARPFGLAGDRLRRITEYINAHLGEALTLDAIAAVACLSPYHLSRSFRRATGIGLHRYVVQCRIERARRLVLETDLPMGEIAWRVGFESQAAFATRFRRETGQPPSLMRLRRS